MSTLAIVIPTMNEEAYLPRLLASIKAQCRQPEEIVIADAKSTDQTRKIAQEFGCRVVDGGLPSIGRNRGAAATSSDLIFFFDADVVLTDPEFLDRSISEFEERQLDIATTDVQPIAGTKYDLWSHKVYNRYVRFWGDRHPHTPGFCILVRRSLHDQIGGFDESVLFCEDHDYAVRVNRVGKFGFLSDLCIEVSTRRQERDGRFSMGAKYLLAELHLMTLGSIRHNLFNYQFGHDQKIEHE